MGWAAVIIARAARDLRSWCRFVSASVRWVAVLWRSAIGIYCALSSYTSSRSTHLWRTATGIASASLRLDFRLILIRFSKAACATSTSVAPLRRATVSHTFAVPIFAGSLNILRPIISLASLVNSITGLPMAAIRISQATCHLNWVIMLIMSLDSEENESGSSQYEFGYSHSLCYLKNCL